MSFVLGVLLGSFIGTLLGILTALRVCSVKFRGERGFEGIAGAQGHPGRNFDDPKPEPKRNTLNTRNWRDAYEEN